MCTYFFCSDMETRLAVVKSLIRMNRLDDALEELEEIRRVLRKEIEEMDAYVEALYEEHLKRGEQEEVPG